MSKHQIFSIITVSHRVYRVCFKFQLLFENKRHLKSGPLSLLFDISHTEAQDD